MIGSWWVRARVWRGSAIKYLAGGLAAWDALAIVEVLPWPRPQIHTGLLFVLLLAWLEQRFHSSAIAYRLGHKAGRLDQLAECERAHGDAGGHLQVVGRHEAAPPTRGVVGRATVAASNVVPFPPR